MGNFTKICRETLHLFKIKQKYRALYMKGSFIVGKIIYKNQLDATITIYWSLRSAQHFSGNLLPIFRSVRLRVLQHMV